MIDSMPKDNALVVLNYNDSKRTLAVCQMAYQTGLFSSIVVVNNKGADDELAILRRFKEENQIPCFFLIESVDKGYCDGCNQGLDYVLKRLNNPVIFLLNSDVSCSSDCFVQCRRVIDENPRIGAVSPLMKLPDRSNDHNWGIFPTYRDGLNSIFFFGERRLAKKQFANEKSVFSNPMTSVDWIRSSFLALRASAFKNSPLFDSRFFLYCGEYSLFTPFHKRGFDAVILSSCAYLHNHLGTSNWKRLRKVKIDSIRSMYDYLVFYRHINWFQRFWFLLVSPLATLEYDLLYWRIDYKQKKKSKSS